MATVGERSVDPEREFRRCVEAFGESVEELREAERSMACCVRAMQDAGASPARLLAARSILNQVRGAVRACDEITGVTPVFDRPEVAAVPPAERPPVLIAAHLADVAT